MVVIAEGTQRLLGNLFELQDLGPKDLKGIAGPIRAWAAIRPGSGRPFVLPAIPGAEPAARLQRTKRRTRGSLHFQSLPVEGGYHRSQVPILDDVSVRTLVWLGEERRRNDPLSCECVPNLNAVFGPEINAFQPSVLRFLAEPGEQCACRLAAFYDLAAGQIYLEIIWILREEPIPIAVIERIQMLGEDSLLGWLCF